MKAKKVVFQRIVLFLAFIVLFAVMTEGLSFAWGGITHKWINTRALQYLKQKNITPPSSFEYYLTQGNGDYADNTGKQVTAACELLDISWLGASKPWDLDGLRHFFLPNNKISIHASTLWKEAFAQAAQTDAFCGDIVQTGNIATPQYANQLYNRAIEHYPGGNAVLNLKNLHNLTFPQRLGMVTSDSSWYNYVKKRYYAGWTEGTDPKAVWSIIACDSPTAATIDTSCTYFGGWCCKCCDICSESCVQNNLAQWPAFGGIETKNNSAFYLGWALHMIQDSTNWHHIHMEHGELHESYEEKVSKELKNISSNLPLIYPSCVTWQYSLYVKDPNYKIPSPPPESWYKHCYNPVPDYLDELISGKVNPTTLNIESFVKKVAKDVNDRFFYQYGLTQTSQYDLNRQPLNQWTPEYIEISLDAAIKATAAVIYKYMWEIETMPLPSDAFEPNSEEFPKTITPGYYYNLTFHSTSDIDSYKFIIPSNFQSDLIVRITYDNPAGFGLFPVFPYKDAIKLIAPNGKTYYPVTNNGFYYINKEFKLASPVAGGEYKLFLNAGYPMYYNLFLEGTLVPDKTENSIYSSYDILEKAGEYFGEFNIDSLADEDIFRVDFDDSFKPFEDCIDEFISIEVSYDPTHGEIKVYVDFGLGYVEVVEIPKMSSILTQPSPLSPASRIDTMTASLLATNESLMSSAGNVLQVNPFTTKTLKTKKVSKCILYSNPLSVKPVYIKVAGNQANTYTLHVKRQPGHTEASCDIRCNLPPGVPPEDFFKLIGTGTSASKSDNTEHDISIISTDDSGNIYSFNLAANSIPVSSRGISFLLPLIYEAIPGIGSANRSPMRVQDIKPPPIMLPLLTHYFVIGTNSEGTELLLSASNTAIEGKTLEEILSLALPSGSLSDPNVFEELKNIIANHEDLLTPYGSFATLYAVPLTGPARAAGLIGTNLYGEYAPPADPLTMLATNPLDLSVTKPVANLTYHWTMGYGRMPITFDASNSYNPVTEIVQYEWDWNGDGIYDETTTEPTVSHSWEVPFITTVTVRVTGGGKATESVNVSYNPNTIMVGTFYTGSGEQYTREFPVPIDPSLNRVVFTASVDNELAGPLATGPLGFTLISPNGDVITPSTENAGYESGLDYEAYNIVNPLPGIWYMRLSEEIVTPALLGAMAQADIGTTNITILAYVDKQIATVNESVTLNAELKEALTIPILSASVTAMVQTPTTLYKFELYDDGGHRDGASGDGIYGNSFSQTNEAGLYSFMVTAEGVDSSEVEFLRTAFTDSIVNALPDNDGMPDDWEDRHGLDKYSNDSLFDHDEDGLANLDEYLHKTYPMRPDTDMDGFSDGEEVANGTNPLDPLDFPRFLGDLDGDGDVDKDDKTILQSYLNMSASNCTKCDLNNDGRITGRDISALVKLCTRQACKAE